VWAPPSAECGGCFYCLFPDGTLINCDGDGQCDVAYKSKLDTWDLFGLIAKTELDLQQTPQGPPDLVPLPAPASAPPEGFCRRNNQGQLLVNVYNQGGGAAAATKTRIIFGSDDPVDFDTPTIANGTGTELVINIPDACYDPGTLMCSFTIGVDASNDIVESSETNNNATGLCGPQFL
jgi:subtilase family serine protease